ncbi:aldo/keto reductase [Brachybacterium saurashtrense]|uniref:Aldo/keto reductase n=1 Tax=Brachybacterium saurashtrense TaxID=556288 RepID=A0A345YR58_9MICO|nr:aldo/keto reductase [Brachybacterium saurashtrense]AXK46410.1 aldo/keto reductase [Brachybacterium saurashtrense]RRR24151.1 aldo/keto reductase [Brachybacterium saurashtrense]
MTTSTTAPRTRLPRTDLEILPLNLGGNTFGWTSDRETSFAVLDAFLAAGGTFIDTADVYAAWAEGSEGGDSETVLGEWLTARGNRDHVVLATKVGAKPSHQGLAADTVDAALDESLARLRTDHVDLYYFHYDDEDVAIAEQVRIADGLVRSGRVRHIGLSNYSVERMREWFEVATREGLTVPVAIQPHYNLLARAGFEQGYAAIAREYEVAVLPYFALASGLLTGKYRTAADLEGRARKGMVQDLLTEDALTVIDALVEIADSRGTAPATIALAWLLAKGVTAPIASASTPEQLPALLEATALELTADEAAALDRASAPFA